MRCWRRDRARVVALVATAVAAGGALFAGCGNERRDFRVEQLNPLVRRMSDERAQLAAALQVSHPHRARDAQLLRARLGDLESTAREIATLTPPHGTTARFRRYTRANGALLAALRRFVDAYATGGSAQQRAAARLVDAATGAAGRAQIQFQQTLR